MSPNRSFQRSCFLFAALWLLPGTAFASSPTSGYTVPAKVEYFPNKANATSVIIHGAFFFWLNNFNYTAPKCGYMYFVCPQAQSLPMCRMQWSDIEAGIGQPFCMGFGQLNMMEKATLRTEGTPPANPDPWDLGMGVSPASPNGAISQCQPATQLSCPGSTTTVDMASSGPVDMATPAADLAMQPNPADLATSVKPDLAQPPLAAKGGGCGVGGRTTPSCLALFLLLVGALVLRHRRA